MFRDTVCAVAGASGFLGRRLTELLVDKGVEVRAIVRTPPQPPFPQGVTVSRGVLSDAALLKGALEGATVLFNCVGHSADWGTWQEFHEGNIHSVDRLLRAAARAGIERVIHVSTTDVYGYPREAGDESQSPIDVGLPYNRSKIAGDVLARRLGEELGICVTVVRPATIFGPRSHDWVLELSKQLQKGVVATIAGGKSNAGLVFVDDVAHAMISLAGSDDGTGVYNIVDPIPMSWRDYFNELSTTLNVRPPWVDIPEGTAMVIARLNENIWRLLRIRSRPLLTRHLALLMTRDQHYNSARLRAQIPGYPFVGLRKGIQITQSWLAENLRMRQKGERSS